MRDWGDMPKEIVTKVAEHVESYQDFVRLQKICAHWRSAAKQASFRACVKLSCSDEHTLPLLLLPELAESTTTRRLYSLSKNKVCHIELPSYLCIEYDKKRLLSAYGWLLVLSERAQPFLFNPFTNAIIELPKLNLYHSVASYYKLSLSANPSTTCDFTVFVSFYDRTQYPRSILVYWRNGDDGWIHITKQWPGEFSHWADVTFYKGEFYGAHDFGCVVKFETAKGSSHFRMVKMLLPKPYMVGEDYYYYLAESLGQLLVICQVVQSKDYNYIHNLVRQIIRFQVYTLDYENSTMKEVLSLGNRSIFIGSNSSFSVEVSPSLGHSHGFKPDCIYYINNWGGVNRNRVVEPGGGRDHCVYNLGKKMFETNFHNVFPSVNGKLTPFTWVEPPM